MSHASAMLLLTAESIHYTQEVELIKNFFGSFNTGGNSEQIFVTQYDVGLGKTHQHGYFSMPDGFKQVGDLIFTFMKLLLNDLNIKMVRQVIKIEICLTTGPSLILRMSHIKKIQDI